MAAPRRPSQGRRPSPGRGTVALVRGPSAGHRPIDFQSKGPPDVSPLSLGLVELPTRPRSEYTMAARRDALQAADEGWMRQAADLTLAAMTESGYARGILADLTHGIMGLPMTWKGDPQLIEELKDTPARVGEFQRMFPEPDRIRLMSWGITLGLGVGQMRRQYGTRAGRDYPISLEEAEDGTWRLPRVDRPIGAPDRRILRTWNPKHVRCEWWNGPSWYLMTADGEIRIEPVDGSPVARDELGRTRVEGASNEWMLYRPYGDIKPWEYGAWKSLTIAFILGRDAMFDRSRHAEILAPIRVGTVPAGTTETQRRKYLKLMREMQRMGMFILPPGLEYKIVESTGRVADIYAKIIEWAEREYAMITGAVTTATGQKGFSRGDVQERFTRSILSAFAQTFATCIYDHGLVPWGIENAGTEDVPRPEWDTLPPEDKQARAETVKACGESLKSLAEGAALFGLRPTRASVETYVQSVGFTLEELPPLVVAPRLDIAQGDRAKALTVDEIRADSGRAPIGGKRGAMLLSELDAANKKPPGGASTGQEGGDGGDGRPTTPTPSPSVATVATPRVGAGAVRKQLAPKPSPAATARQAHAAHDAVLASLDSRRALLALDRLYGVRPGETDEELEELGFGSPDQARDDNGRWTSTGGGSSKAAGEARKASGAAHAATDNAKDAKSEADAAAKHDAAALAHKAAAKASRKPEYKQAHEDAAKVHQRAAMAHRARSIEDVPRKVETPKKTPPPTKQSPKRVTPPKESKAPKEAPKVEKAPKEAPPTKGPAAKKERRNESTIRAYKASENAEAKSALARERGSDESAHVTASIWHGSAESAHEYAAAKAKTPERQREHLEKAAYHKERAAEHRVEVYKIRKAEGEAPKAETGGGPAHEFLFGGGPAGSVAPGLNRTDDFTHHPQSADLIARAHDTTEAIGRMPANVQSAIHKMGVEHAIVDKLGVGETKQLAGKLTIDGREWEKVGGVYVGDLGRAFTTVGSSASYDPGGTALHEIGHAVDYHTTYGGSSHSGSKWFTDFHEAALKPGADGKSAIQKWAASYGGPAYYFEGTGGDKRSGRAELFAELWSQTYRSKKERDLVDTHFPGYRKMLAENLHAEWKKRGAI